MELVNVPFLNFSKKMKTYKKHWKPLVLIFFAKNGFSIVHAKFQVPSPKND